VLGGFNRKVTVILCTVLIGASAFTYISFTASRLPNNPNNRVSSGDIHASMEFGGLTRTYLIHVPPSYDRTTAMPLLLVFHGGGGTGEGMAKLTHMSNVSDEAGFIAVYPDGYKNTWNDGRGVSASELAGVDDVGFISKLIDTLSNQYRIDSNRVYATGMSNGGFFTDRLACELSDKIAAVAVVAATMSPNISNACSPARPLSVMIIQGTADPLVPIGGGEVRGLYGGERGSALSLNDTVKRWVQMNECAPDPTVTNLPIVSDDGTRVLRETYGQCTQGAEVVIYIIDGGGHAWPGGIQYLPESIIGKTSRNMDASQVIWAFLASNPRP
jgi:polyhydroxybutyrate depolymerase